MRMAEISFVVIRPGEKAINERWESLQMIPIGRQGNLGAITERVQKPSVFTYGLGRPRMLLVFEGDLPS